MDRIITKYPFTRKAKEFIASRNITLGEIVTHPVYSAAIERGKNRFLNAVGGKELIDEEGEMNELTSLLVVMSYPIAHIIANLIGGNTLRRYASGEAKFAYALLRNEAPDVMLDLESDLGVRTEGDKMPLIEYLSLMARTSKYNPETKIVNHIVDNGYVYIQEGERKILLREAIQRRIEAPVEINKTAIPAELVKMADNLAAEMSEKTLGNIRRVDLDAIPPCIRNIMDMLRSGGASHNSMFILATFLINTGMPMEDIEKVFSTSQKYDSKKTRYQLDFLSGRGGGTKYSCPHCATIKSYGLCTRECNVNHPLQYYRNVVRSGIRKEGHV